MARRLEELLEPHLSGDAILRRYEPLTFADSEPEPDFALVRGKHSDFLQHHPSRTLLVVEISAFCAALDREKASLYAEAGVREYWIILATERRVEIYRQPENGSYLERSVIEGEANLQALSLPALSISLAELFA